MAKISPDSVQDSHSPKSSARQGWVLPAIIVGALLLGGLLWFLNRDQGAPVGSFEVLETLPHRSTRTYTQGLEIVDGIAFESTGQNGEADWRLVDLKTGKILQVPGSSAEHRYGLPRRYFGEGITVWNKSKLVQLTYKGRKGFVWDVKPVFDGLQRAPAGHKEFEYPPGVKEGWGLTHDDQVLIMSTGQGDGLLHLLDPETLSSKGTLPVTDGGTPVAKLNELEYVDGFIYANVYQTDYILKIDRKTGEVVTRYDMNNLLPEDKKAGLGRDEVLNGIAYDHDQKAFYVTGKNWPSLFRVKFIDP